MKKRKALLLAGVLTGVITASAVLSGCGAAGEELSSAEASAGEESDVSATDNENSEAAASASGESAEGSGGQDSDSGEGNSDESADAAFLRLTADLDTSGLPHYEKDAWGDFPSIDGSTATLPLSYALFRLCTGATEAEAKANIYHTTTNNCYYSLVGDGSENKLDLAYEPSQDVLDYLNSQEDQTFTMTPIGRDALVFMENRSNPVNNLSEEQIVDIYSGKIRNWSRVGGNDAEIRAFQREQGSGSQAMMDKLVMKGETMAAAPSYEQISGMGELLEAVSNYDNSGNAIGYSVYFYTSRMNNLANLKLISVDGVYPDNDTIQDGSYPYVNDFYATISDSCVGTDARKIYDWLLTEDGQELLQLLGYVPVKKTNLTTDEEVPSDVKTIEDGPGSLSLGEDNVLILDRSSLFGDENSIMVTDSDFQEIRRIPDVTLAGTDGSAAIKLADSKEPCILYDTSAKARGLMDLESGEWILDPEYDDITKLDDGTYRCTLYDESDGSNQTLFYIDGEKTNIDGYADQVRNHYISSGDGSGICTVYDRNGDAVTALSGSYWSICSGYILLSDDNGGQYVCDENGNVLFSSGDMPADVYSLLPGNVSSGTFYFEWIDPTGSLLIARAETEDYSASCDFAYDLADKKILTGPGEDVEMYGTLPDGTAYYTVHSEDGTVHICLGTDVQPVTDADGKEYSYCLVQNDIAYLAWSDGTNYYADPYDAESARTDSDGRITMNISGYSDDAADNMSLAAKGIFVSESYDSTDPWGAVWVNGELSEQGDSAYSYGQGNYSVVYCSSLSIYQTESGEKLTGFPSGTGLIDVTPPVIIVNEGSYLCVCNSDGELVRAYLPTNMQGD